MPETTDLHPPHTALNAPDSLRLPEYESLVQRSIRALPFSMANPLARSEEARRADDPKEAFSHLLDFFEMSVQWLNACMLALLAPHAATADPQALKTLRRVTDTIDTKRPLSFGDSVNELFHHLLIAAVRMTPDLPLIQALTKHVDTGRASILTGSAKKAGVVKVRNDFKGHSTVLARHFYARALDGLSEQLMAMLRGLEPLHAYRFIAVDSLGHALDARSDNGLLAPADDAPACADAPGHYYAISPDGECHDMYPMAMLNTDGYIFIFQTLKDEGACYESASGDVHRFETESLNPHIDAFFRRISPAFDVAREANWQEITEAAAAHSSEYMRQVQKDKKYSSELFVERKALSGLLDSFAAAPGRTLLALPGEAGQGKTCQLCHWTSRLLRQKEAVFIFNSADMAQCPLPDRIREIMHSSRRRNIERLLDTIHKKAEEAGKLVYFFFDALNECLSYPTPDGTPAPDGPTALFLDVASLLVRADRPRFKVVATCRSFTWKNRISAAVKVQTQLVFAPDDGDEYSITGFTADETREAYSVYGKLYQMGSDFSRIDSRILLRLRDPLTLKYACGNHVGTPFGSDPARFTSISLFGTMLENIRERSFAGRMQCELLDELADRLLDSYISGHPAGGISAQALREALTDTGAPLHRLATLVYTDGGVSVAYAELIRNPERPILKESVRTAGGERTLYMEFIYERFLEYMMALSFGRRNRRSCGTPIAASAYLDALRNTEPNVVLIGTLRNALLIDLAELADFGPLLELAGTHGADAGAMQLITDTIDVLVRENYERELSGLQQRLLDAAPPDPSVTAPYNATRREIASGKALPATIARHRELAAALASVLRLRATASAIVGSMLLSDYFNESLYETDPMQHLWRLMEDPIADVADEACKQAYYLSHSRRTRGGSLLRENLTVRIVREMFADVRSRTLLHNVASSRHRKRMLAFIETGARLATLLIIDAYMAPQPDYATASAMLDSIRGIASYATARFTLVRAVMPFLQTVMRKQVTFQSDYVNNAIEYQSFWHDDIVPPTAPEGRWCRARLAEAMSFVGHYNLCAGGDIGTIERRTREFRAFHPYVLDAYTTGCSFSYFIIERLLVVTGAADWDNISPLMRRLLAPERTRGEWADYTQMSLLYVLYQVQHHAAADNPEILDIFTREAADWTRRCRGLFEARNSARANATGLYKRNVMNWYGVVYCDHIGDGVARDGHERCAPLFYEMLDEAIDTADKNLLFHLLDNIAEMICDCGLIELPLQLTQHVLTRLHDSTSIRRIDSARSSNPAHADTTVVTAIGRVLSAAHRFYPERTSHFLHSDVAGLSFPGVAAYREEILGNISDTEKLSDLFTHRFGNFLMWSLLHNEAVDSFAIEAVGHAPCARDSFQWYDRVVRTLCRHLFNIKI